LLFEIGGALGSRTRSTSSASVATWITRYW
jgi:hypothetical protein